MGLTKIEWTSAPRPDGTFMPGYTANLWWGCTRVHEGCDHCYAETLSNRWGNDVWGNDKPRKLISGFFKDLNKYQELAEKVNEVHRVFVGSMMDIFEKPMPLINSKGLKMDFDTHRFRCQFFSAIDAGDYNNLMFLLLTKRPSNINKYIPESWKYAPPKNVMFGTSPVNQETYNKLVAQLMEVSGLKFLSIEPQLDFVDISGCKVDWIIQGGESGRHKRPFDLNWAYSLRNQCESLGIPYFFKQIDKIQPIPADLQIREFPL